ncbi:hypothetical protein [Algicella marina]|uniref:triacylglycerol lipase n=1 Tax=Algicella marina TaxID=2683284 RepID=A0A6P1SY79_9RHOB|nr:hypothetical protein [Algicella marina]QHQ34313.1 hypothetical protein GO499_03450 [Algicella marina]
MATIQEYALMSQAVYADEPQIPGWACANFHSGLGTGLQAAVFTRGASTVVAYKGTTPSNTNDLLADLKLGVGMNTSYFWNAEAYAARYAPGEVVFTGHSLGGAIAQIVGNRRRLPFVTFNAPGVALFASRNVLTSMPHMTAVRLVGGTLSAFRHPIQMVRDVRSAFHSSLGVNYRLSGDVISQVGLHYGNLVSIQGAGDPLTQHGIGTMITALEGQGYGDITFPN